MNKLVPGLFLIAMSYMVHGQKSLENPEKFVERLFSQQEMEADYERFYENLLTYYSSPLNINKASHDQLLALFLLNNEQIFNLLDHISKNGELISVLELQTIEGFDQSTIKGIRPFITVGKTRKDQRKLSERLQNPDAHSLFTRFTINNNSDEEYLGPPGQFSLRYRFRKSGDYSVAAILEKDNGESYWNGKPDFYSFHLRKDFSGILNNIVIGDFQYQTGQGLIYGSGFSLGKGSETILTTVKPSTGCLAYSSGVENGFLRGIAATLDVLYGKLSIFGSTKNVDARIHFDSLNNQKLIRSFPSSGYHRTTSEIETYKKASEQATGGYYQVNILRNIQIGSSWLLQKWNYTVTPESRLYNSNYFNGSTNYNVSGYFNSNFKNLLLFGEYAISKSGGKALVAGITSVVNSKLELTSLFRNYERDYHASYANGFGERSQTINESGIYFGLKIKPTYKQSINIYYDIFYFPWATSRTFKPSAGQETMVQYTNEYKKNYSYSIQIRYESKQVNQQRENARKLISRNTIKSIINFSYPSGIKSTGRTRIQYSLTSNQELSGGWAIMQDYEKTFRNLNLNFRYAVFDTDFDNRQYAYEKDVLYAFSIPAYQGLGSRIYVTTKTKISENVDLWLKASTTQKWNERSPERTNSRDWMIRLQLGLKLN